MPDLYVTVATLANLQLSAHLTILRRWDTLNAVSLPHLNHVTNDRPTQGSTLGSPLLSFREALGAIAGSCSTSADPTPPVARDQCAAAALNWVGDAGKAALAYNYTGPTCNYKSKPAETFAA